MILTLPALAKRWECDRRTALKTVHEFKIPYFRLGREYRFRMEEIEKFERGEKMMDQKQIIRNVNTG